jgi:hypothetical protein
VRHGVKLPYGKAVQTLSLATDPEPPRARTMYITFRPNIELISSTRRFAAELFETILSDPDATSRVALTIHELLENTLKYSTDGVASLDVGVDETGEHKIVRISASNRATPEKLDELRRRIDELKELADPMEVYVSMLIQAASREHGSGLGLARIRVEAEMNLTYDIEGDRITIVAVAPVQSSELATSTEVGT